ncbi:hypothetical protein ACHWQZ_G007457 [Mnemiopsis leidyi]
MLLSTVFLPVLLCLGAVVAVEDTPLSSREVAREFRETLKKFKSSSNKVVTGGSILPGNTDVTDRSTRRNIYRNFKKYAQIVNQINHDDTIPFNAELNKFSIEPASSIQTHFGLNMSNSEEEAELDSLITELEEGDVKKRETEEIPDRVDWSNTLSEPEHQNKCGSCWSFSTITSFESAYFRTTGLRKKFSYQELVDCVYEEKWYGNGCTGAPITTGLLFVLRNKHLAARQDYSYVAKDEVCKQSDKENVLTNVALKRLFRVPKTDDALMRAVTVGVVSVGVKAGRSLLAYKSGIYYDPYLCSHHSYPNHAVNLVGYGEKEGQKYWLVRNSWGVEWGEGGYYRMTRDHPNHCKIAETAVRLDLRCINAEECEKQKEANGEM